MIRRTTLSLTLCVLLPACATQQARGPALPFHIAVAPVNIAPSSVAPPLDDGSSVDIALAFDEAEVSRMLVDGLRSSFVRVTPLTPAEGAGDDAWLDEASAARADLIVDVTLRYHPALSSSLNDRFWLNLPLFALGGPFSWFVADRSYHFQAEFDAGVFDVTTAAHPRVRVLEDDSSVLRLDRPLEEASLNFLDRADGVGSYFLSLIVPAGFLSRSSEDASTELQSVISQELSAALARSLKERGQDLTRSLVDFYPVGVHVVSDDAGRALAGEFVLDLGNADELGSLRYRFENGEFMTAEWGEVSLEAPTNRTKGRKLYPFRIPLDGAGDSRTVQIEVEQLLANAASRRTFTYSTTQAGDLDR
ncbi:MAG: hypothetical protein KDB80_12855 [Planctomycetes bacterium]|nr:hypothetical protein [Planctomycetota bacterium]